MHKSTIASFSRGYEEGSNAWDFQHLAADLAIGKFPANDDAAMAARGLCYAEFPTRKLACGGETGKQAWNKIGEACKASKFDTPIRIGTKTMTIQAMAERVEELCEFAYRTAKAPAIVVDGVEVSQAELEAIRKLRKAPAKS